MNEFYGKLCQVVPRTANISSFQFTTESTIDFAPGQFVQLVFDEQNKGNRSLNKYLSFSCAPGKPYIEVTKKLSESDFSKKLASLKPGADVLFKGPLGACVFKEAEHCRICFLVGGIGITPVIAILEYIVEKKLPTDVVLLYSNWTYRDIAFKAELDRWAQTNSAIGVIHTLVNCHPGDPRCLTGMISKMLVLEQVKDFCDRTFFIFGPPGMVSVMRDICREMNCRDQRVVWENFLGY